MKTLKMIILLILLVGIVQAKTGVVTGGTAYAMLPWFKNSFLELEDDVKEAKQRNRHILLFFHLAECPYCEQMVKDFDQPPLKALIQNNFSVIAIDIRGDKEVAINAEYTLSEKEFSSEIGVRYTPTVIFLNQKNETIMRTNGYRSPAKMRQILDYISNKFYEKLTLAQYLEKTKKIGHYHLKNHAMLQKMTDFSTIKTPLAVIFEDANCDACGYFYNTTLKNKNVASEFNAFKVVRLDADSTEAIIDNTGNKTTPKNWIKKLKLTYRPGIILLNKGKEVTRIDGFLYPFHFKEALRYVSSDAYERFATYGTYLAYRQAQLLEQGADINIK